MFKNKVETWKVKNETHSFPVWATKKKKEAHRVKSALPLKKKPHQTRASVSYELT